MSWELPVLPIFPEGSLASSVITTVWVGVGVVAFFNLRLGWSLAGLVVPGYLVPLLLFRPWNVAVIIAEGIVTYLLVWSISALGGRYLGLAHFFGRERFFAILLASVAVRVVFDGFLLPDIGAYANQHFGLRFDYENQLHSFGLIIVALIAHNFWKPGLVRGSLWLLVTLFLTFVLVRFGLMALTNFSLGNLAYLYEDIASSIFDSPKAYIILLTTALIASRMNLHYAWEFNGIIIPSLLALQWYQPVSLAFTFIEVAVLLLMVKLLFKLPWLSLATLTGARKLFLFFTLGLVYKLLLGHALNEWAPEIDARSYFAFGYLISALLAIKIHDKDIGILVTRATLQTSLVAVILASFFGFALSLLPLKLMDEPKAPVSPTPMIGDTTLESFMLRQRILEYASIERETTPLPTSQQLTLFEDALSTLQDFRRNRSPRHLQRARLMLGKLDYDLRVLEDRYLVLRENTLPRGFGTYVIDTRTQSELVIQVPDGGELGAADAGLALFHQQKAAALAIGGITLRSPAQGAIDATRHPDTLFHRFHRHMSPGNSLQLRLTSTHHETALRVKQKLPADLKLTPMEEVLGRVNLRWESPRDHNIQRESTAGGFAELLLSRNTALSLIEHNAQPEAGRRERQGSLHAYLIDRAVRLRNVGQPTFIEPGLATLLYFDREVLTPLLKLIEHPAFDSRAGQQELAYLDSLARGVGYCLIRFATSDASFLVLEAANRNSRPPWGTYIFRVGESQAQLVEVPRPFFEQHTLEAGVALFRQLKAKALLIAGRHPFPNPAGQLDALDPTPPLHLFNQVHQTLVREAGDAPLMISQVRGMENLPALSQPGLVALASGVAVTGEPLLSSTPLGRELESGLSTLGLKLKERQGEASTAGYEVGFNAQAQYLDATRNKQFASLWLTSQARDAFAPQSQRRQQKAQFQALGIETVKAPLAEQATVRGVASQSLPTAMRALLFRYHLTGDIMALRQLQQMPGYRLTRLLTPDTDQAFLLITTDGEHLLALANLAPISQKTLTFKTDDNLATRLEAFAASRAFLLHSSGERDTGGPR
ncbi:poly-gamma-glutamate biosynthesis protein PgsC/CapC [Vreelandella massiliensis]|uniref:poly-gamma-glutamate biosynthesis protein PgsC/CapC n=1 Tax=Vreelandella massiliensis TaxID=1816686 RepID=UPI0009F8FA46|nr:poly-gamma-glutamate biosynthesis protein PgsC/CapC [Halomonas massiliensis]